MNELLGYKLWANDGHMGTVHDFFFNDEDWRVCYLVVNTGVWILGRKVLISLQALGQPVWASRTFPVDLTRQQVKASPRVDLAKPVSRQYEEELNRYYRWPAYWGISASTRPAYIPPRLFEEEAQEENSGEEKEDPHLRSVRALTDYQVETDEGKVGPVVDFIVDDEDWSLRYLVVETEDLSAADKKVLIAVAWIRKIVVAARVIRLELTGDAVQYSPPFDPGLPVNRRYEEVLYDYYGRPKYWRVVD
ncbi:MAG: hypothetical protein JXB85_00165 [Anaerolineales bacterium]|nr:hypothetical protein [Anaerolineales bacterium]